MAWIGNITHFGKLPSATTMSFAVVPVRTLYNVCLTPPLHEGFRGGARRLDLDDPDATTRYMVYYNHIRDIFQILGSKACCALTHL